MANNASSRFFVLAAFAAAFFAIPLASAFTLSASSQNLGITPCSDGQVYVYVQNPFSTGGELSFSASFGQLHGFFDAPSQAIAGGATRGSYLHVSSPQCFKGWEDVTVYGQLCIDGECRVEQKTVRVNVEPCSDCNGFIYLSNQTEAYYIPAAPRTSDGTVPLASGIYFASEFDPSFYELNIFSKDEVNMRQGETAAVELSLVNEGAAGTFDLRAIGDVGELEAYLSDDYVSLARGEARTVRLDVQPSTVTGKYCAAVQATRAGGIVVQEKYVCFNVYDKLSAEISLPTTLAATRCDTVEFDAKIRNTGTAQDTYRLRTTPFSTADETYVTLSPGEYAEIGVAIDANALALGRNKVAFYAEGENVDALTGLTSKGKGIVNLFVSECRGTGGSASSSQQIGVANTTQAANGTLIKLVTAVVNEGNGTLEAVTAEIFGLPNEWTVTQQEPNGITVEPGQTRNLTLWVQANTPAEAEGTLSVKSNGTTLYSKPVKINGKTGDAGIVGFFTMALSGNSLFISVLILAALVVIVMAARGRHAKELEQARLDRVKKSITE
ncbi:MAG: hypothetical protein WC792_00165 [Candidatus Micrarchaeia archaeon]|jgi:hypothetical protein